MIVEFELTLEDIHEWQRQHAGVGTGKRRWTSWLFVVFFGLLTVLALPELLQGRLTFIALAAPVLFVIMLLLALSPGLILRPILWVANLAMQGREQHYPSRQRVSISQEGLDFDSDQSSRRIPWDELNRITETADYLSIMTTRRTLVIIPRRAFRDEEECQLFVETADRYQEQAVDG